MPQTNLDLAREHLTRVQVAAVEPVDWSDLTIYGFHAVENAVVAAADHVGLPWERTHPSKVDACRRLAQQHGLPDASALLIEPNTLRKSQAYGEAAPQSAGSSESIAAAVETYVDAVAAFVDEAGS